jgi:hypothetical protein
VLPDSLAKSTGSSPEEEPEQCPHGQPPKPGCGGCDCTTEPDWWADLERMCVFGQHSQDRTSHGGAQRPWFCDAATWLGKSRTSARSQPRQTRTGIHQNRRSPWLGRGDARARPAGRGSRPAHPNTGLSDLADVPHPLNARKVGIHCPEHRPTRLRCGEHDAVCHRQLQLQREPRRS